jgi:O-antigen/teichoic acid export membrane protein
VLLVAGPSMVSWLYGDGFEPSGRGLRILALGVVPSTVATFRVLSMLAEHREREVLQTVAVSASVLAGLLLVLVPMVGWIGACWALTIADVTQAIALTIRQRTFTARTEPARLVEVMS